MVQGVVEVLPVEIAGHSAAGHAVGEGLAELVHHGIQRGQGDNPYAGDYRVAEVLIPVRAAI